MNPQLSVYFAQKRLEEKQARVALLVSQGLYEKVYAPKSQELPNGEYPRLDTTIIPNRPYKAIPIEITDEEYEQVKKYAFASSTLPEPVNSSNGIATVLTVIGVIVYLIGFIGFFAMFNMNALSAFIILASAAISGTMFLGFAEIIKLLQSIKNKN